MRTVEHGGDRYLLVKRSADASLVRDPRTGEERYLPTDELSVTGESPLATAAAAVPSAIRPLLTGVHSEEALGLIVLLEDRGPLAARELLAVAETCESDLHGLVGELRAAGLLEARTVDGQRGYATTDVASEALERLRS